MKKILWTLFFTSVAADLWLLSHRPGQPRVISPVPASVVPAARAVAKLTPAFADGKSSTSLADSAAAAPLRDELVKTLVALDTSDLIRARDALRAAGAEPSFVYGIVDGIGRVKYSNALHAAELENLKIGWWRGNPARGANVPSWTKVIQAPVFEAVGADPLELVDYSSRFTFLPADKARRLAQMGADFNELQARVTNNGREPDPQARQLLAEARRQEVLDVLTPEERAEFDLRFSDSSAENASRFTRMQATEKEFRAIQPLLEQLRTQSIGVPRDPNSSAAASALEQQTFDQIVAAVGFDRAVDFVWSNTTLTGENARSQALDALASPPYAGRVLQLAAETGAAAAAIHADVNRSLDEKRAALLALQLAAQPKLDDIIPSEAQQQLPASALNWLRNLSNGDYTVLTSDLSGRGTSLRRTLSVTSPPRFAPAAVLRFTPQK